MVMGFIGWEVYAYLNDVQNIPMMVFLGLTLLSLFYIMIAGLRKGNVLNYFKKVKDDVFYEYSYQKMFARPSIYWASRFEVPAEKRRRIWFKNFEKLGFKDKVSNNSVSIKNWIILYSKNNPTHYISIPHFTILT
jgi:hypothetical protein